MEFCPKCGSVIIGKNCARCDYKCEAEIKLETSQKLDTKKEIVFIDGEHETDPVVKINCVKCNNGEAYFWTRQTRSGDEAETRFFKCLRCKHTWREYR